MAPSAMSQVHVILMQSVAYIVPSTREGRHQDMVTKSIGDSGSVKAGIIAPRTIDSAARKC